ncbi:hypothetical protein [Nocardia brasiliensis]|uniref:hypothetical protein n=1 Tax=Nocardia brasiliensis TaxID=37326 RepID=UPI0024589E98|nr:hypothetical protein [Nocardia brasiliensis]
MSTYYIASPSAESVMWRIDRFGCVLMENADQAKAYHEFWAPKCGRLAAFTDSDEAQKWASSLDMRVYPFIGKRVTYADASGKRQTHEFDGSDFIAVFPG